MGNPNHFLAKLRQCAIQPIISIDFNLRSCGEALLKELESPDWDKDEQLNWPVAANAYAYSFALAYYTAKDHGARLFSMMNEPENRFGWFFLPGDIEQQLGDNP